VFFFQLSSTEGKETRNKTSKERKRVVSDQHTTPSSKPRETHQFFPKTYFYFYCFVNLVKNVLKTKKTQTHNKFIQIDFRLKVTFHFSSQTLQTKP